MKNLIICLFFSCSFLLGNSVIASALAPDGGVVVIVINYKMGQTACSFELPKDYQLKNNTIEITLKQVKGNAVYSAISDGFSITLPASMSGTFLLTLKIDDFIFTEEVSL